MINIATKNSFGEVVKFQLRRTLRSYLFGTISVPLNFLRMIGECVFPEHY